MADMPALAKIMRVATGRYHLLVTISALNHVVVVQMVDLHELTMILRADTNQYHLLVTIVMKSMAQWKEPLSIQFCASMDRNLTGATIT